MWHAGLTMSQRVGRNDPCPCGSGKKFKRCCLEKTGSDPTPDVPPPAKTFAPRGELTLLVETPRGVMARTVPSASPLSADVSQGYAAEEATHDAAAVWGLPDFVYLPETTAIASGTRELGDGIVILRDLGIVIQVKSREAPSSDPDKERRWLEKKTLDALRQGDGTIRRLKQEPAQLTNLRGTTVEVDGNAHRWLLVVVLDHPNPPDGTAPSVDGAKHPAVVVLRRDWEFLFDQLKSTHAVAQYFERIAGETTELGEEPVRYYNLALADHRTPPEPLEPALRTAGRAVSTPLLPMAPAASDDLPAHQIVRTIFEDIAITRLTRASEADRLRVLAELDRLPVGQRAEIGRFILDAMTQVHSDASGDIVWSLRSVRGSAGRAHLGFGACSHPFSPDLQQAFSSWVQLRHHDHLAITNDVEGLTTVAVLLTPRDDGQRPWDTTVAAVSGALDFSADELKALRTLWPTPPAADL